MRFKYKNYLSIGIGRHKIPVPNMFTYDTFLVCMSTKILKQPLVIAYDPLWPAIQTHCTRYGNITLTIVQAHTCKQGPFF